MICKFDIMNTYEIIPTKLPMWLVQQLFIFGSQFCDVEAPVTDNTKEQEWILTDICRKI